MRWIVGSSARLGIVVLVVVAVILAGGVALLGHAPVDTLPELLPTRVQIQTAAVGLSSHEAEQFLAVPAEYELANVAYLDSLKSRSVQGLTSIDLTFKPGVSIATARQLVSERMAQVPLPVDVGTPPVLIQPLSSSSRAMMIALTSNEVAPIDLTTLAKWRIRPRLLAVPGVANVTIWGQRDREMLVLLDPDKMSKNGVTIDQVMTTVGDSMWTSPLTFVQASTPGADGLIDTPNQRLPIQHILPIITSKDLVNVPIADTGARSLRIGDVATVIEDHTILSGDAVLKNSGLVLVVEKLPGADALTVDQGVDAAMNELKPGLAGIAVDTSLQRPGTFLSDSIRAIGIAGLIAFIVICLWLGIASRSWRVALSAAVSIAASLLGACLVLFAAGTTFNVMVFAGLVMALGIIVDDAVIGTAALRSRAKAFDEAGAAQPKAGMVVEILVSGRRALGFTFAALVLVSVPFFFVPGLAGTLSVALITTYLVAIATSALVAAVVAPALAVVLLPPPAPERSHTRSWLARSTEAGLRSVARWPGLVAALVAVVVVASIASVVVTLPRSFTPTLRDGSLVIQWQAFSGTSLAEMKRITALAEVPLRALPAVRGVASHVGPALEGDQLVGTDAAQTWINLDPNANYESTVRGVNQVLAGFPGLRHTVGSYADSSMKQARTDSRTGLKVRVYGPDYVALYAVADKVRSAISGLPGVANTRVTTATEQPLIQVETDILKAAKYGLKPGDVRRQTAALVAGIPVGSYYQDQQVFEVAVWGGPALRQNPQSISDLPITTPAGTQIPLKTVASVSLKPTTAVVDHEKASRFVDVTADVSGVSAGSVAAAVKQRMSSLALPLGYHTEVSSPLAARQTATANLALLALAAAIGIYLLLQAALQSWRKAAVVFVLLPFAVSGAVLAAAAFGWGVNLGVVVGVVAVLGIALRNGVQMVRRFEEVGDAPTARGETDLIVSGTSEAALPVVMTAVGMAIGVSPFLVLGNVSGIEVLKPFAVVVLFGLLTSTAFSLLVLPALYRRWGAPHGHAAGQHSRSTEIEGAKS